MSNFIEMKVRVAHDSIELPAYETTSSAGMDLRALKSIPALEVVS